MSQKVIIVDEGNKYHLPEKPHFRDGTDTLCNVIDEGEAKAVPITTARQRGYAGVCHHCQSRQNALRRRGRGDSVPTPDEAVRRIRRLRGGADDE